MGRGPTFVALARARTGGASSLGGLRVDGRATRWSSRRSASRRSATSPRSASRRSCSVRRAGLAPAPRAPRPGPARVVAGRRRRPRPPHRRPAERGTRPGRVAPEAACDRNASRGERRSGTRSSERSSERARGDREMLTNATEDDRPPGRARRAVHGHRRRSRRHQRARDRARARPALLRRLVLVQRQARDQGRPGPSRSPARRRPALYAIVEDLTQRAGMPMPRLYVSPEQQPNAFATGRSPHHAAVCVTAGHHSRCSTDDELEGVLAHELSHVTQPRHPHRVGRGRGRDGASRSWPAWRCGARCSAAATTTTLAASSACSHGDPRPDRGDAHPDGDLAVARVRGRRRRRASSSAPASRSPGRSRRSRPTRKRVPMNVNPAEASAYIINPLAGPQGGVREPVLDAPADRGAHPAPPEHRRRPRDAALAGAVESHRQSRKLVNWSGMPKSCSRIAWIAACRSSRFLPLTRS